MSNDGLTPKSIKIREYHDEWLEDNEGFNLSGHVREMLDEEMGE